MNRYILFAYNEYCPNGGWNDFNSSYESLDKILEQIKKYQLRNQYNWYQILDTNNWQIIKDTKKKIHEDSRS